MKNLIFIGGPMGVGKTTVSKELQKSLDSCVFLDGDWCWYTNPWILNAETRKIVIENIKFMLNNYIKSESYKNIIFCWVMHDDSIITEIIDSLDMTDIKFTNISLICEKEELINRLNKDIDAGLRTNIVINRALMRLSQYDNVSSIHIDTTNKTVNEVKEEILTHMGA